MHTILHFLSFANSNFLDFRKNCIKYVFNFANLIWLSLKKEFLQVTWTKQESQFFAVQSEKSLKSPEKEAKIMI